MKKKKNGSAFKKLSKKKQKELKRRAEAFQEEYRALARKHKLDFSAAIVMIGGLPRPVIKLVEFQEEEKAETKPWSECLKENLETRMNCEHVLKTGSSDCKKCKLSDEFWGKNGFGVKRKYQKAQEKQIKKEMEAER